MSASGSSPLASPRLATRLAFIAAGIGMAAWAPLAPFAKARTGVDDATFGLLLLCLGVGSVVAMPLTGHLIGRVGSRPLILLGGLGVGLMLPVLAFAASPPGLALALLVFGASLGSLDVAMNAHAVEVEAQAEKPLMSGFHALFSIGGFAGAGGVTLLLTQGVPPLIAGIAATVLTWAAIGFAAPGLIRSRSADEAPGLAFPRGVVLLLALLAAVTFLAEGAVLDWGALLSTRRGLTSPEMSGVGYMLFSAAMTIGRLTGDRVVSRLGPKPVLGLGGGVAVLGFAVLLLAPIPLLALSGFVLIGLGAANIVPVLFSAAGRQTRMPAGAAVAAVTTIGYAGVLAGPAAIGFVAQATSLMTAFWLLAALLMLVPLLAGRAARTT